MIIDNIDKILPFLIFDNEDDFYYLQILQRKKENKELGSNSRVIKNYYINNKEYLLNKYDEIKELCTLFNARASLRLNRRSYEKVAFKTLENIANTMQNREYNHLAKSYDRACGLLNNEKVKRWILDIDDRDKNIIELTGFIGEIEPKGNKILEILDSKNGFHIITRPFNLETFKKKYLDIEVHKDNPTNLYIP